MKDLAQFAGGIASQNANITGSATITSFGNTASITSQFYFVTFAASPLITASSSILTPQSANIQAIPGAQAFLAYLGNGVWQVISYTRGVALPAPQVTVLTTGTGTYTTPTVNGSLPLYLDITDMCGAGSGGGASGVTDGLGTVGGDTTFGTTLLTAHGGPAPPLNTSTTYPTAATATGGDTNIAGALGGAPNAFATSMALGGVPKGASSPLGQGGNPGAFDSASSSIAATNASGFCAGGGAGGAVGAANYNFGWGGNAGAYLKAIITSPAATYAYVVGAAGVGGTLGTSGGAGSNGSGGYIRVVAHWQ